MHTVLLEGIGVLLMEDISIHVMMTVEQTNKIINEKVLSKIYATCLYVDRIREELVDHDCTNNYEGSRKGVATRSIFGE